MYLFIFAVLLILFQFINSKNVLETYETDITELKETNRMLKDSVESMDDKILDLSYFNLDRNEDALTY